MSLPRNTTLTSPRMRPILKNLWRSSRPMKCWAMSRSAKSTTFPIPQITSKRSIMTTSIPIRNITSSNNARRLTATITTRSPFLRCSLFWRRTCFLCWCGFFMGTCFGRFSGFCRARWLRRTYRGKILWWWLSRARCRGGRSCMTLRLRKRTFMGSW